MPEELNAEEVVRHQFEAMSQAAVAELEAVGNSEGASAWRGYSGRLLELIQESPLEEGASLDAWRGKIMQRAMQELQRNGRTRGRYQADRCDFARLSGAFLTSVEVPIERRAVDTKLFRHLTC